MLTDKIPSWLRNFLSTSDGDLQLQSDLDANGNSINNLSSVTNAQAKNDGTGIQNAINDLPDGEGIVRLGPGGYDISSTITVPKGVHIIGAGMGSTMLYPQGDFTIFDINGDGLFPSSLRNLEIYDNGNVTTANLVDFESCWLGIIDNCRLEGGGTTVYNGTDCYALHIKDSRIGDWQNYGVDSDPGGGGIEITNTDFKPEQAGTTSIRFTGQKTLIENCYFEGRVNGSGPFIDAKGHNGTIINNYFSGQQDNSYPHIKAQMPTTIKNNSFDKECLDAIQVSSEMVLIESNSFESPAQYCINIQSGGDHGSIKNNVFSLAKTSTAFIYVSEYAVNISHNIFKAGTATSVPAIESTVLNKRPSVCIGNIGRSVGGLGGRLAIGNVIKNATESTIDGMFSQVAIANFVDQVGNVGIQVSELAGFNYIDGADIGMRARSNDTKILHNKVINSTTTGFTLDSGDTNVKLIGNNIDSYTLNDDPAIWRDLLNTVDVTRLAAIEGNWGINDGTTGTAGPAWYNGTNWISLVDGSTI